MRPSNRLRERSVATLRAAYLDGALSTDTFEVRTGQAYRSSTMDQLARLVADLPTLWNRLRRRAFPEPRSRAGGSDARIAQEPVAVALPNETGESVLLGRSRSCDVLLTEPTISRQHLRIRYDGMAWRLLDLASTNGTFMSGRRVDAIEVRPGDIVYAGNGALRLVARPN